MFFSPMGARAPLYQNCFPLSINWGIATSASKSLSVPIAWSYISAIQFNSCEKLHDDFRAILNKRESLSSVWNVYKRKRLSHFYDHVHKYCWPHDDAWKQEVSIPLLSRKSGEDNLPARMSIDFSIYCRNTKLEIHCPKMASPSLSLFLSLPPSLTLSLLLSPSPSSSLSFSLSLFISLHAVRRRLISHEKRKIIVTAYFRKDIGLGFEPFLETIWWWILIQNFED